MLKIWYDNGIDHMIDAPLYFDNVFEDEWMEDELVKEMVLDVDKSKVLYPHVIESPFLGPITPRELSGGVKVLILLLKDDSWMYNISNCGDNCAKWILEIGKQKDLTVYLEHHMYFEGEFEIEILNTGRIVHNQPEYLRELLFAGGDISER
jgi:hypothetical protein